MKNIIFTLFIALFFSACVGSSLHLDKSGELKLNHSDKVYLLGLNSQYDKMLNFKDLFVKQYRVENSDGTILFYENLQSDMAFEFNFAGLSTVMYAFDDSKKYEKVYKRGNVCLVQIMLKNESYVNVLIEDNSLQEYSFIYGFSNEEFLKIAQSIKLKDTEIVKPKFEVVSFNFLSKPLTNWNDLLIFFTPLITPLRELRSF